MRKTLLLSLIISMSIQGKSQDNSKPITEIFADFHYYKTDSSASTVNGFGLTRAYLGYSYQPREKLTATVIVNVGNPSDLSPEEKQRRYAFLREASIAWSGDKLNLSFGMTRTRALMIQQRVLDKRFVAENFEVVDGFTTVADLGFSADYTINEHIKFDFTLMNGEGYHNLNVDNSLKSSFGITINPTENGIIRLYSDFYRPSGILQQMYIAFLGYKNEFLMIGGGFSYKTNPRRIEGHNAWGLSTTASVRVAKKTELFGRYDYTDSHVSGDNALLLNHESDRQFIIAGVIYTFNEFFRIALDYQGNYPGNNFTEPTGGIFLNTHFRF